MKKTKLIVIGIDGGSFNYLQPLMDDGVMPNLKDFFAGGQKFLLTSTVPPMTAPAFISFATGTTPGQHGIFSFYKNLRSGDLQLVSSEDICYPAIWDILGSGDKKVIIINVPMTYPARPVNGILISGLLTPSKKNNFIYPPSLTKTVSKDYIVELDYLFKGEDAFPSRKKLLNDISRMTKVHGETACQLLASHAWDFATVIFTGPDRVTHFFWDELMRKGESHEYKRELNAYFSMLDDYIGHILKESKGAVQIVMSDHGSGPAWKKKVSLPLLLDLYEHPVVAFFTRLNTWLNSRRTVTRIWKLTRLFGLRRLIYEMLVFILGEPVNIRLKEKLTAVNFYGTIGGYHFEEGYKPSSAGKKRLIQFLKKGLTKLKDPDDGKKVVQKVSAIEEVYGKKPNADAPDVLIFLDDNYFAFAGKETALISPMSQLRTGDHKMKGVFGIKHGKIRLVDNLTLVDLAPTILQFFGIKPLDYMHGRELAT